MRKRSFLLVAGACLATLSLAASTALADPQNPTGPRQIPGVGSDTSQAVMNGYGNGTDAQNPPISDPPFGGIRDAGGTKIVASYDATGTPTINTRPAGTFPQCQNIPRPNGSTAGVNALAGINPAFPAICASFARSSNNDSANRPGQGLTYIPFARDAITYATLTQSNIPRNLTQTQLQTIFRKDGTPGAPGAGAGGCFGFFPLVPQAGSGTRAFWNTFAGPFGTCVRDVDFAGNPVQEHDGRVVGGPRPADVIVPFGVAPWIFQDSINSAPQRNGNAVVRGMNGKNPFRFDGFIGARDIYNVIRTADIADPAINSTFVGPNSAICSNPQVIEVFGFERIANCGSTAIQTPPN